MSTYDVSFRSALTGTDIMRWCRNNLAIPRHRDFYMRRYADDDHYELTVYDDEGIVKFERNRDFVVERVAVQGGDPAKPGEGPAEGR